MSKTCLHICFAVILALFVVNLNANPKPKADNGIDIIINRVGPMLGLRMLGLQKPIMPQNLGPEPKEVEPPAQDDHGYRSAILPAAKPAANPAAKLKKLMKGAPWISPARPAPPELEYTDGDPDLWLEYQPVDDVLDLTFLNLDDYHYSPYDY